MGLALSIVVLVVGGVFVLFRGVTDNWSKPRWAVIFMFFAFFLIVVPFGTMAGLAELFGPEGGLVGMLLGIGEAVVFMRWANSYAQKEDQKEAKRFEMRFARRKLAESYLRGTYEEQIREEVDKAKPLNYEIETIARKHDVYFSAQSLPAKEKEEFIQEWRDKEIQDRLHKLFMRAIPNEEAVERIIAEYGGPSLTQDENL